MSQQQISRPIDWDARRFETSHTPPRVATLMEGRSHSGKRRVMAFGDYQMECRRTNPQYDHATVWHYNEDGTLDGDMSGEWKLRIPGDAK